MRTEALAHKSGGYRAYKKIAGREFQFYSKDREEANRMQQKFESLAALNVKKPFSKCGRLLGFRFHLSIRPGKSPYIGVRVQVGPFRNQTRRQWKYSGSFEENWQRMRETWAELHGLQKLDVAAYTQDLKAAKRLYIQDASKFEEQLKEHLEKQKETQQSLAG